MSREETLDRLIRRAQAEEAAAKEAETRANAVLQQRAVEMHQALNEALEPLRARVHDAYAVRSVKTQRTKAVVHASALSEAEVSALLNLETAPADQVSALFKRGLVRVDDAQCVRTPHGERVVSVLRELSSEGVQK